MGKINCDICGTVYQDNANACPICGYPRKGSEANTEDTPAAVSASVAAPAASAERVKGGRFSNKNVKKRNNTASSGRTARSRKQEPEKPQNNRGLLITIAVLLIAIVLVGGYIIWRFLSGADAYDNPGAPVIGSNPSTSESTAPSDVQTDPVETGVPCVGMSISDSTVELTAAGRGWKLSINLMPEDTTEELTLTSSDEAVVTVTQDGRLTAVGPGSAIITITCGQITKECTVHCTFQDETEPEETTEPVETTEPEETTQPTETTEPEEKGFKLSHSDVTLFFEGETFTIKPTENGSAVSPAVVVWASSDESVATVSANGKVTAVAGGKATISATYNGETLECIVRCSIEEKETEPAYADSNWSISHSDVSIVVGESFTLKLTNDADETASVSWSADKSGVVSVSGNKITGVSSGTVDVSATIDGKTYTCIVRVK